MQRKYSERRQITVYLNAEEYEVISKKAGQGKISEWARDRLLEDGKPEAIGRATRSIEHRANTESAKAVAEREEAGYKKLKTCPHGKEKGWRCTLCGGIVQ